LFIPKRTPTRSRLTPSLFFSISLVFSISLFHASASAQGNYFLLGGGLDFSTFNRNVPSSAPPLPDQSMRTGFNILAGFQYGDGGNEASIFGIGYETRGAVWKSQSEGPAVYAAPLLDLAILTSSELEVGSETVEANDVNSIDLDLGLSLGVQVPMARNAFFMEAGYAYGLLNTVSGETSDDVSFHNSAIKLRAGFLVGI
jgi:hypothetical protein